MKTPDSYTNTSKCRCRLHLLENNLLQLFLFFFFSKRSMLLQQAKMVLNGHSLLSGVSTFHFTLRIDCIHAIFRLNMILDKQVQQKFFFSKSASKKGLLKKTRIKVTGMIKIDNIML